MRLIYWDKVLEWMHRQKETKEQWSMRIAIENYVDNMPTVDAVEVVRCKNCKYCRTWYFDKDGNCPSAICTFWDEDNRINGIDVYKNGFCSNGKRREDEKNRKTDQGSESSSSSE
jgi:hypothetical protein